MQNNNNIPIDTQTYDEALFLHLFVKLACDIERPCAVGFAPVILSKAGVSTLIGPCHIEYFQTSILPYEHPAKKGILHPLRSIRYEILSTTYEGRKSSVCNAMALWMMKALCKAVSSLMDIWLSKERNMRTPKHAARCYIKLS